MALQPDLTICIDIDTEVGLERVRSRGEGVRDRMEEQTIAFHKRVREIYLELGASIPERIKIIDGNGGMEDVAERVWRVVESRV